MSARGKSQFIQFVPRSVICGSLLLVQLWTSVGFGSDSLGARVSDPQAGEAAIRLFDALQHRVGNGILFGQHDAPLYGLDVSGATWRNTPATAAGPGVNEDRSDVKTATGSHPALVGFDLEGVMRGLLSGNSNEAQFLTREIQKAHLRGQVVTLSWHAQDPVDGSNFSGYPNQVREARRFRRELLARDPLACARDVRCSELTEIEKPEARRVLRVLPGGANHRDFMKTLDVLGDFLAGLKDEQGAWIPVVFRPWHEHNGGWFWWGGEFRTSEEFAKLWRLTVNHLRETRGLHHLLVAYSPNQSGRSREDYWNGYPGDSFVDVLGFDAYHVLESEEGSDQTGGELGWIVRMARERGKIPALTETGLEAFRWGPYNQPSRRGEPNPRWFTHNLGRALHADPDAGRIAYVMVWRNASATHHYFPGPSARETIDDFLQFRCASRVLLVEDVNATPLSDRASRPCGL